MGLSESILASERHYRQTNLHEGAQRRADLKFKTETLPQIRFEQMERRQRIDDMSDKTSFGFLDVKSSYKEESIGTSDYNEKIIGIRVRAIWLLHGSVSAVLSTISGPVTGSSVTHWWVEIETEHKWYCALFDKPDLVLSGHNSRYAVTKRGKEGARYYNNEQKNITDKYTCKSNGKKTIGDLARWMQGYLQKHGKKYNMATINCQHFGTAVYKWI
eukprot:415184_1